VAGAYSSGGVGDFEGAVGEEFGVPAGPVEEVVVAAAQQHQVGELGRAAGLPGVDVVAFAPGGGTVTAREPAVAVTDHEGVVEGGGDRPRGGAVVQDRRPAVAEDAVEGGVAEQPVGAGAVEAGAVDAASTRGAQRLVAVEVEDQVEVGPVAATPAGVLVVEEVSADVTKGVGPAGGDTPGGFAGDIGAVG
jgi:hypothetical protein